MPIELANVDLAHGLARRAQNLEDRRISRQCSANRREKCHPPPASGAQNVRVDASVADLRVVDIAFDATTLRVIAEADGVAKVAVTALPK